MARHYLDGAIDAYDVSHRDEHLALYAQDPKAVPRTAGLGRAVGRRCRPGQRDSPSCSRVGH